MNIPNSHWELDVMSSTSLGSPRLYSEKERVVVLKHIPSMSCALTHNRKREKVLFELTCEFYKELGILETWDFIFLNYLFVFESAWTTPTANSSKCRNLPAEDFCRFQFNSSGNSPSHHRISVISSAARYQPPTGKLKGDGVTPWRPGNCFVFIVNATVCISNEGQTSKLWSSQLWTQFKQLRIETWKGQDFNWVWTRDLAIPVRLSNQLSPDFFRLLYAIA